MMCVAYTHDICHRGTGMPSMWSYNKTVDKHSILHVSEKHKIAAPNLSLLKTHGLLVIIIPAG